jgi:hypothetical protein
MMSNGSGIFLSAIFFTAAFATTAVAGDVEKPHQSLEESSGWVFQVTPYIWAAGLEGDISPFRRLPTVHVDKSFSDVMNDLNFGGFINLWARNDRFVFSGDVMYVSTTDGKVFGPVNVGPITIPPVGASVDETIFNGTLLAGYRLYDEPRFTLDVLGGLRFNNVDTEITVSTAGRSASIKSDFGWLDPVAGARAHFHLTDEFSILAQGDIGGFGAGSDLSWQALATVNYSFDNSFTVSAGYKILSIDYASDGHVFDTMLNGPVLGLTYRF